MASHPPLIIELAVNGPKRAVRNPHVPLTSEEIVADVLRCMDAGASVIHTHHERADLFGSDAVRGYAADWAGILARRPDAVLCCTIANGTTLEEKFGHYAGLASSGMMAMAPWDPGSVNLGASDADGIPCEPSFVYANPYPEIAACADILRDSGLGPSIAVFEPGFLRTVLAYHDAGKLPPGAFIKFYFSGEFNFITNEPGCASFGLPPTEKALDAYLEMLGNRPIPWAATVLGGDVVACGMARLAVERGGHVRVGVEDFGGLPTPSNAELVTQAVALGRSLGRDPATPAQASRILGLPASQP